MRVHEGCESQGRDEGLSSPEERQVRTQQVGDLRQRSKPDGEQVCVGRVLRLSQRTGKA